MKKLSGILVISFTIAMLASCTTVKEPAPAASTTTTSSTEQVQTPAATSTTVTRQSGGY